jgi:hypothetical protein
MRPAVKGFFVVDEMEPRIRVTVAGLAFVCLFAVAGCGLPSGTSAPPTSRPSPDASTSSAPPTAPYACPTTAALLEGSGALPERQGVGDGATLWALFFPTGPSLTAGNEIKVVWRMTGSGDLSISASGPGGVVIKPRWGPEPHGGSSYERPGDEWGTGWVFPAAGCWTVNARRTVGSATLAIRVDP